jgi:plastocyanin
MKRVLLVFVLLLAACGSSSHHTTTPTTPAPSDQRGQKTVSVTANQNQFSPATIIVSPGTTVTWYNGDLEDHNIQKADDNADFGAPFGAKSPQFLPRDSYSFTFNKVGTYAYTCTIHTGMNGIVRVEAGAPSVTSSTAVG